MTVLGRSSLTLPYQGSFRATSRFRLSLDCLSSVQRHILPYLVREIRRAPLADDVCRTVRFRSLAVLDFWLLGFGPSWPMIVALRIVRGYRRSRPDRPIRSVAVVSWPQVASLARAPFSSRYGPRRTPTGPCVVRDAAVLSSLSVRASALPAPNVAPSAPIDHRFIKWSLSPVYRSCYISGEPRYPLHPGMRGQGSCYISGKPRYLLHLG